MGFDISIKGFVLVNQNMSVKRNGMWRLNIWNTIILVGILKHQNISIRILTMLTWSLICSVPKIDRTRKNLKTFYIALMRPNLNEQCDYNILALFRNGITYFNYSTVIINWSVFCFLSCFMIDFC